MLENSDFEKEYWSRTATGIYKKGLVSIRLKNWICFCDMSYYENINSYDLMGSIWNYLNEISTR